MLCAFLKIVTTPLYVCRTFVSNMTETAALRRHWNSRSCSYDRFVTKGFSDLRERHAWQDVYADALGTAGRKILDVGCGPGIVSMQLSDLGYEMTALDFSEKMLEKAEKNAADNGLDIEFVCGNAMELPFGDCSFDAVVSDYVLWTVPDPRKVMDEWYRVLRPGGRIVYVDGDWSHDRRMTFLKNKVSSWACRIEDPDRKNDSEPSDSEAMESLWSFGADRPNDDIAMMERAGFRSISVRHGIQKKVLRGMRYLAYGLTNDHFMVTAEK